MERQNLGELGESTLRLWMSQENAMLNKAYVDRTGWDFILEFPTGDCSIKSEPDKKSEAYQCFIQVKSTDLLKGYHAIRLSNWKHLIETPLPAFFLILYFGKTETCQNAFLVHVWEKEIAQVLRKARALGVAGKGAELNKHYLRLKWGPDDQLPEPTGHSLLTKIRNIVGPFPSNYAEKRSDY